MQIYEAPTACVVAFEVVNIIAASVDDPENLVVWGSRVAEINSARDIPM